MKRTLIAAFGSLALVMAADEAHAQRPLQGMCFVKPFAECPVVHFVRSAQADLACSPYNCPKDSAPRAPRNRQSVLFAAGQP